jgi:shikimate dehydrogenase
MRQQVVEKTKEITGKTRVCGLIGDPVEHSISPAIHNAAFHASGLDYIYIPFHVKPKDLKKAIDGMRALHIRGLNVTIPHKVAVIPFLDRLDVLADRIGAVNTIVNDNGVLTGFNTDAMGFLKALVERDIEPTGKKVLLLGAGGAARAIGFILAEERAHLTILNRKQELSWAKDLADCLSQNYTVKVSAGELNRKNLLEAIANADILVNATSVGMSPNVSQSPVPADLLCSNLVVFDIVYNPYQTQLLREAKEAGAQTISGLEMLVWQGALAFEKFTGKQAPVELMREAALKVLQHEK